MKKISVAIVTYNHEKYIKQALDSVLKQKGDFKLEIIVGDDCSKDKTREILKKYKEKHKNIKLILNKKNVGVAQNLVNVFNKATGDYIAVLEGDDYWESTRKLDKQFKFLETHPDYFSCGHDVYVKNQYGELLTKDIPLYMYHEEYERPKELAKYNYYPTLSIMYRNENDIVNKIADATIGAKLCTDYAMKTCFVIEGKAKILKDKLGTYRYVVNENSYSSKGLAGVLVGYNDIIFELGNIIDKNPNYKYIKEIKKDLFYRIRIMILICIKSGNFKKLKEFLKDMRKRYGIGKVISAILLLPVAVCKYVILIMSLRKGWK